MNAAGENSNVKHKRMRSLPSRHLAGLSSALLYRSLQDFHCDSFSGACRWRHSTTRLRAWG